MHRRKGTPGRYKPVLTSAHLKRATRRGEREGELRDCNLLDIWETADFRDFMCASRSLTGHEANSRHNTIYQLPPCDSMSVIRDFFTKMNRGGKKNKHKPDGMRAEVSGSKAASSTSSLPRPPHVVVGGGHDQEGHGADVERREAGQRSLHPDVEVVAQSRPSGAGSDVHGKKTDRPADPPDPSPSTPSTSHGGEPERTCRKLIQFLPLIGFLDNTGDSSVPDHVQEPSTSPDQSEPNTTNEKKLDWKSAASATAKLLLRGVSDSADAVGPLKSVAGGLCFILENCEVRPSSSVHYPQHLPVPQRMKANEQAIESLAPRIKALSALLCTPVSGGDTRERPRRKELER